MKHMKKSIVSDDLSVYERNLQMRRKLRKENHHQVLDRKKKIDPIQSRNLELRQNMLDKKNNVKIKQKHSAHARVQQQKTILYARKKRNVTTEKQQTHIDVMRRLNRRISS